MSAGTAARLSAEQQLEIGHQINTARGGGARWDFLVRVYNRSRASLWRYAVAADAAEFLARSVSYETSHGDSLSETRKIVESVSYET